MLSDSALRRQKKQEKQKKAAVLVVDCVLAARQRWEVGDRGTKKPSRVGREDDHKLGK